MLSTQYWVPSTDDISIPFQSCFQFYIDSLYAAVILVSRYLYLSPRCVMILTIIVGLADLSGGSDRRAEYYAGLRKHRLFRIAESDCLRRLAGDELTEAERAELTIELSKSFAAHAAFAVGEEQEELWNQAAAVLDELLLKTPTSRFRPLVATQRAMVPAAQGSQLRWQSELLPLDEAVRQRAESTLRDALKRLKPLPGDLDEALRLASTAPPNENASLEAPRPFQVHGLSRLVAFTTASAAFDLARVLPAGVDRTAALHEADRRFDELSRIARPDNIAWQSRVHRLDIVRIREPANRLAGQVSALLDDGPPPKIRDAAVAVLVRSYLEEGRADDGLAALEEHRQQYGLNSEQLQAMVVETLLSARRVAQEKGDAALAAELLRRSEQVDARLTGPWRALTRLRLSEAREEDRYGPELAKLVNAANWAWKNGNSDAAVTAFGRAATHAHQQRQTDFAVELALTAASIQVETGQLAEAVRSLEDLLRAYPSAKQSAEADLLRAYAIGRIYQQRPTAEHKEAYRFSLERHRASYTDSPTEAEATWMLARLIEHEQKWESALELYASIAPESPRHMPAVVRMARVFEQIIDRLRSQGKPTNQWQQRAEELLSTVVESFPSAPSRITQQQAEVAVAFARILLHRTSPSFLVADALLARVVESGQVLERENGSLSPPWQALIATAAQWRIISLTGQGRLEDAEQMLGDVQARHPGRLLDVLSGLSEIAGEMGIEHRQGLGRLQLQLAEQLKSQSATLSEGELRHLDMALAQAQAAVGQRQAAIKVYEELLWKQPHDQEVLQALATLYEECGTSGCLADAMKQWRALESLQRKGTVEWLLSRYHMAWCSHQLGDQEAARKLIGVTQVLYPKLGSPVLKAKFEALAREIEEGPQK